MAENPAPSTDPPTPNASRKWVTAALLMVMVLAAMETTITATAMPTIVGQLQGLKQYAWVASVFLLASTLTMPVYGWLADALGRKRVLLFAIGLFCLGSLLATFATTMSQLILFRGVQGLGAGGIMPVVLTILGDIFTLQERARIQGAFSAVWGGAALGGPILGAFLVHTENLAPYFPPFAARFLGWPSIFWINLPLCAAAALMLVFYFQDRHHHHSAASEPSGSVMAALFSPVILPCLMASGLMGLGVFALDTFVPLYVQGGRGMSAAAAAATVTPVMLAWASSGIFAAPLLLRWGFRKLGLAGAGLGTVGYAGVLVSSIFAAPLWVLMVWLFLTGLGFGPASMAMLLAAQDAATYRQRGMVTSGIAFSRNLGGAVGISLLGALFNLLTPELQRANLPFETSDLLDPHKLPEIALAFPDTLRQAQGHIAYGLLWVFGVMLTMGFLQLAVTRRFPRTKRSQAPAVSAPAAGGSSAGEPVRARTEPAQAIDPVDERAGAGL